MGGGDLLDWQRRIIFVVRVWRYGMRFCRLPRLSGVPKITHFPPLHQSSILVTQGLTDNV
jgi:hypothetical protein